MKIIQDDQNIIKTSDFTFWPKVWALIIFIYVINFFTSIEQQNNFFINYSLEILVGILFLKIILPRRITLVNKETKTLTLKRNFLLFSLSKTYNFDDIEGVYPYISYGASESSIHYNYTHQIQMYIKLKNSTMIRISGTLTGRIDRALSNGRKLAKFIGVPFHQPKYEIGRLM